MPRYFRYFPEANHTGRVVKDITRRVRFNETIATNPYVYLPYTVKEGEKPEDISYFYYGTVDYVWMLYLANNIIDPYYDWPMTQNNLELYIIDNFAEEANTTGRSVLEWSKNTEITDNVLYWENEEGDRISQDTYSLNADSETALDDDFVAGDWSAVRVYDYEFERNESNRHIFVIDKKYADQIENELREKLDI